MIPSILLRLDGPLQSWGDESVFAHRATRDHPTKSGVLGLISAAMGRDRSVSPLDLAASEFAVRLDQTPRTTLLDYHTIGNSGWTSTEGKTTIGEPKISEREYLEDAVFVAALLLADDILTGQVVQALASPRWSLYLGRRSCPPAAPILMGTYPGTPLEALTATPYQGHRRAPARLTVVHDDPDGVEVITDQPVSFDPVNRRYLPRRVTRTIVVTPPPPTEPITDDPLADVPDAEEAFAGADW